MLSFLINLGCVLVGLVAGLLIGANNPGLVKSAAHKIEDDAKAKVQANPAPTPPPTSPAAPSTAPPAT